MKRTDLLQQADRLDDSQYYADKALAAWLRQIAQVQPVAWAWGYADIASPCLSFNDPAELRDPDIGNVVALYTLPLED